MTREELLQGMIEEYRKKIDTYQTMIAEWEREMGTSSPRLSNPTGAASTQSAQKVGSGEDVLSVIRDYQFFGKSQPEAAKLVLEMVGHPLKTGMILAGIEKGGLKVGGKTEKDQKQNFYTILNRSSELGRVARDTWGVVGWPGVPRKQPDEDAKDDLETESPTKEETKE